MSKSLRRLAAGFALAALVVVFMRPALADEAQTLVDKARLSIEAIRADPQFAEMADLFDEARGVLLFPERVKVGFILGGEAGDGVLLARDEETGAWSYPAFYKMGSASLGLQAGVQISETIVLVMNRDALDDLLANSFNFGGDANIAVATMGTGVKAATGSATAIDYYTFGRSKGLFFGASLEGVSISPDGPANAAYYGAEVSARDIVIDRKVSNPGAEDLRVSLGAQ